MINRLLFIADDALFGDGHRGILPGTKKGIISYEK